MCPPSEIARLRVAAVNIIPIAWIKTSLGIPIACRYKTPGIIKDPVKPVKKPLTAPTVGESHFSCLPGGITWGVKSETPAYELIERPSNPDNNKASDLAKIPAANQVPIAAVSIKKLNFFTINLK